MPGEYTACNKNAPEYDVISLNFCNLEVCSYQYENPVFTYRRFFPVFHDRLFQER